MLIEVTSHAEIVHEMNIQFPSYWKSAKGARVVYFKDEHTCLAVQNFPFLGSTIEEGDTKTWLSVIAKDGTHARPEEFAAALWKAMNRFQDLYQTDETLSIAIQNELF